MQYMFLFSVNVNSTIKLFWYFYMKNIDLTSFLAILPEKNILLSLVRKLTNLMGLSHVLKK